MRFCSDVLLVRELTVLSATASTARTEMAVDAAWIVTCEVALDRVTRMKFGSSFHFFALLLGQAVVVREFAAGDCALPDNVESVARWGILFPVQ
jgi:hypothetical protein